MSTQQTGGSIVTITAALARNPIRGVTAAVPTTTKGGLETITQHLATEYAKDGIRVNAVAPGAVLPHDNYTSWQATNYFPNKLGCLEISLRIL